MESIFSASEPALGYIYQIRYGLLLITSSENANATLLIEKMDDIAIDTEGVRDVYQTKLHINSVANLTNMSTDFWKTIRVWSVGILNGTFDPDNTFFNLITTAKASDGTIPFKLKSENKSDDDINEIIDLMIGVTTSSVSEANKSGYDSFISLSPEQKKSLVKNINVYDSSIDVNLARTKLLSVLKLSSYNPIGLFERLEGWFLNEVITQLQNQRGGITNAEVTSKILEIADCFRIDNLPNDFKTPISEDDTVLNEYHNYKFIDQLKLIGISQKGINSALSDYYRAFSQKSKWIREGLLNAGDEISYHDRLKEDWTRKFSLLSDDEPDQEKQKQDGKNFYETHYVATTPQIFIRDRFKETYMVTGSCHQLSNKKEIGWHPNFETKI